MKGMEAIKKVTEKKVLETQYMRDCDHVTLSQSRHVWHMKRWSIRHIIDPHSSEIRFNWQKSFAK